MTINLVSKFNYQPLSRKNEDGIRKYSTPDGLKLPSVTSILEATKPKEKVEALQKWRDRVGHANAAIITKEAAGTGTSMHKLLENYCQGIEKPLGTNTVHQIAYPMAQEIINKGLIHLDECWGNELSLFYTGLYAGSTDLAGVWKKKESILDFKQTNKPKKKEWIDDYFIQLCAYGLAHNNMFGTNIRQGVVLMCSRACEYQEFVLEGIEWDKYENMWWDRVAKYFDVAA